MAFSSSTTSTGAQASGENGAGVFRFSDLLRVGVERMALILTAATVVVAVTVVALLLWPSTYAASTLVMLDQRTNSVALSTSVLSSLPTDPVSVQNQIQILTSRDLAARVIADLKLYEDPEFAKPDAITGELPSADAVIDNFERHLTVGAVGLSTTLNITFKSRDAKKAAAVANAIASAYLADQVNFEDEATRNTTTWLLDRIHALARQVQGAEMAVQQYRAQNNLNDTTAGGSLIDQQLIAQNAALVQARSDLAQKQAIASHINSMLATGHGADVSQVVSSPLIIQLRAQEAELLRQEAQLSSKYGPRHPKMVDIESQKANLEDKIAEEAARVGGSASNDVAVARANVGSLAASLKALEKNASSDSLKRVKLKALEANASSTRTMYEAFVTRLRETQGAVGLPSARIISTAAVPAHPSSPKRTLIAAASIPVGLLIGLLLALIAERASPATVQYRPRATFRPAVAAAAAAPVVDPLRGAPVIGEVPDYESLRAADVVIDRPQDSYSRAVETLLGRLAPHTRGQGGKVIALTAADQGEGRTALATALARAATRRGLRAIVIDSDFQLPRAAQAMGLAQGDLGLQDVLSGTSPLSQSLARDTRSNALLLSPARLHSPNAQFLNALPQLIAYLKRSFDLVIVDCPAPEYASASRYFLPLSDAAVLFVRWQSTPRADVARTIDTLSALRVPATGVVFAR
ncbi:MAG TPA: exopolysaccharide transport family protein [Rhizomicrobium sp.]